MKLLPRRSRFVRSRATAHSAKSVAGFVLVELSIALAILGVISAVGIKLFLEESENQRAEQQGRVLASYGSAFTTYMATFAERLRNNQPITVTIDNPSPTPDTTVVINTPRRPTFAQLTAIGILPAGGSGLNLYGDNYVFAVQNVDPSCPVGGVTVCEIEGIVALSGTVRDFSGNASHALAGQVALIAGDAGITTLETPGVITGPSGSWNFPHPNGNVPASVGVRLGGGLGGLSAYLRRDGSDWMTGPLRLVDPVTGVRQDLVGADNIEGTSITTASGTIDALTSTSVNAQNITSATGTVTGNLATGSINNTGAITSTGNIRSVADVTADRDVIATRSLVAPDIFLTGRNRWLSQLLPNVVIQETNLLDMRISNGRVTKPTCAAVNIGGRAGAAGAPRIYAYPVSGVVGTVTDVSGQIVTTAGVDNVEIDNTRLALGSFDVQVQDNGVEWVVSYETLAESAANGGTSYNNQAFVLVQIGCSYN